MKKSIRFLIYCILLWVFSHQAMAITVIYPVVAKDDVRYKDLISLLQQSLEVTVPEYGEYELVADKDIISEGRYIERLKSGIGLNVIWSSTSVEKEKTLRPIRIPLRKGLLGYRISLINKNNQSKIEKIKTIEALRLIEVGQGIGWGDIAVYKKNDIKVRTARYELLFRMLNAGRFDLFPRGVNEVFDEYQRFKTSYPNLVVEQKFLIVYPWPYYFFTNKADNRLAERIENGLRMMIKNGSFDQIFHQYHQAAIEQANLLKRHVIHIENPLLPKQTPLDDPSLWFLR
ncbi:amino acid ABC transporter substrate-binding protein [Zooshikella sp. RANM57]|uniref:amino acid ABC transporter substrate-binding protein n=1 Tax=Zooshikella sp. RANM57 TaxID=3425863 RepID=UPI003D6DD9F2